ncbi:MAG: hypothetical protein LBB18_04705 [Puniceicoccales bacterium]|jgi:hypothetical protein|nr:hypothetical protein [Puniceicoccales bacterium]
MVVEIDLRYVLKWAPWCWIAVYLQLTIATGESGSPPQSTHDIPSHFLPPDQTTAEPLLLFDHRRSQTTNFNDLIMGTRTISSLSDTLSLMTTNATWHRTQKFTFPFLAEKEIFLYHSLPILQILTNIFHFTEHPILNKEKIEKARILASKERIPHRLDILQVLNTTLSIWLTLYRARRHVWKHNATPISETFQRTLWRSCPSADSRAFIPLEEWYIRINSLQQALSDYLSSPLQGIAQGNLLSIQQHAYPITLEGKYHHILQNFDDIGNEWILKPFHFQEHIGGGIGSGIFPHLSHLIGRNVMSYHLGEMICPGMVVETHPCLIPNFTTKASQLKSFAIGVRMKKAHGIPFTHYWKPRIEQDHKRMKLDQERTTILYILNQFVAGKRPDEPLAHLRKSNELKAILTSDGDEWKCALRQWQSLPSEIKTLFLTTWQHYEKEVTQLHQRLSPGTLIRNITRMQWLDALLLQGDRHHHNFYVDTDKDLYTLQLIDNDQCLGPLHPKSHYNTFPAKDFEQQMGVSPNDYFRCRGSTIAELWARHGGKSIAPLPQIIDATTAKNFEHCHPEIVASLADGWLLPEEIAALQCRLQVIQAFIALLRIRKRVISEDASLWGNPYTAALLQFHDPEIEDPLFPKNMYIRNCSEATNGNSLRVLTLYQKLCREKDREQNTYNNLKACVDALQRTEISGHEFKNLKPPSIGIGKCPTDSVHLEPLWLLLTMRAAIGK